MRVGIYYPFRVFPGGGEKYLFTIAALLAADHHVEMISPFDNNYAETARVLGIAWPNIPQRVWGTTAGRWHGAWRDLHSIFQKRYDLFIALGNSVMPQVSGFGRKNLYILQFPFPTGRMGWLQRYVIRYRLRTYHQLIVYSKFVARWTEVRVNEDLGLRLPIQVLYPFFDQIEPARHKQPVILSVGRFFAGGHNKKHREMIAAFRQLCDDGLTGWQLHLAGTTRPEPEHQAYVQDLRSFAQGYPVRFHLDTTRESLLSLYQAASLYWHATGLGENAKEQPELMEHFGITVVEAMSFGAVPLVFNAGGPVEIVSAANSGLVFETPAELRHLTMQLINDQTQLQGYAERARSRAKDFSLPIFMNHLQTMLGHQVTERGVRT